MTRPAKLRHGLAETVARAVVKLEAEGMKRPPLAGPSRTFRLTHGHVPVYVNMHAPDGAPRDIEAARAFLADRPYAGLLVYRGTARERHVFEYDPRKLDGQGLAGAVSTKKRGG